MRFSELPSLDTKFKKGAPEGETMYFALCSHPRLLGELLLLLPAEAVHILFVFAV